MEIAEEEKKEIVKNAQSRLLFNDIDILDYQKNTDNEIITIDLPYITSGNILTYAYDSKSKKIILLESLIYTTKENFDRKVPYLDNNTIMCLLKIARKSSDQTSKSKDKRKVRKRKPKNKE